MSVYIVLIACKIIGLVEKAIEDDGKTRRLVIIAFAFALAGSASICVVRL
ncbi:hypothetical protein IDM40_00800 [Nocardiopsis sp. HNM0947]|uniref:Uncharacterized protein n=1 Tax=Nocardiopsis coralli TaxID=2772213 RepID=A0ABR9P086_9ACTN|nr:hypothetical protein [Nocardiopsis coralli]MBE2997244.1 hypothetical protein [Nocardiopsis coralli]